jgi:hypothetical protein
MPGIVLNHHAQPERLLGVPRPLSRGAALPRRSTDSASLRREACAHVRPPDVPLSTGRAGMRPGRTLVQYGRAGTPTVDDAGATGRAMATGPASVHGVRGTNAGNDGEKSRDQKGSHTALLFWPRVKPNRRLKFHRRRCCRCKRSCAGSEPPAPGPPRSIAAAAGAPSPILAQARVGFNPSSRALARSGVGEKRRRPATRPRGGCGLTNQSSAA